MRLPIWLILIVIAATIGCSEDDPVGGWEPTPPSNAVADWVALESFPEFQYTHRIVRTARFEFFRSSYGEGLDCPSGCYYSSAYGVRCDDRIGWFGFEDEHGYSADPARYYDFAETDTVLCDVDAWITLLEADRYTCLFVFLPQLATDEDTCRGGLLALAAMIYTHFSPEIGQGLVENPSVATDREILMLLAGLPVVQHDAYASIRAHAQELLDGLGGSAEEVSVTATASSAFLTDRWSRWIGLVTPLAYARVAPSPPTAQR